MNNQSLPPEIINQWPEVLKDVVVRVVPLAYLHSLKILFKNGKIWDLSVASHFKTNDIESLTANLRELLKVYETSIESIDFQLDVERVKQDSVKLTNKFFKTKSK